MAFEALIALVVGGIVGYMIRLYETLRTERVEVYKAQVKVMKEMPDYVAGLWLLRIEEQGVWRADDEMKREMRRRVLEVEADLYLLGSSRTLRAAESMVDDISDEFDYSITDRMDEELAEAALETDEHKRKDKREIAYIKASRLIAEAVKEDLAPGMDRLIEAMRFDLYTARPFVNARRRVRTIFEKIRPG